MGKPGIAKTKAKILPNQAEHMELDYAGKPEENATHSKNNKKFNSHVTEQASLLRYVLYSSCLVPCISMHM
jgi:hypothetical protein